MTFGDKLKELRTARGASQRTVAGLMGVDPAYLSRVENDARKHETPNVETITKIVKALRLTRAEADSLFVLAGRVPPDVESKLLSKPRLFEGIRKA